jgi:DNA topoisomerase I
VSVTEVDASSPGYGRKGAGRGFSYVDCEGDRITDPEVIARIKALAIPPAWRDVWICTDPQGHIQATGIDAAGRRQYRYHDDWRVERDRAKHDRMLELAQALPRLRRRVARDLAADGMGRDKVLACAVRLLELGLFRVGGEGYADDNGSYGLATLRKGHVRVQGDELRFDYPGKSGQRRIVAIGDEQVAAVVRALKRRRRGGPELLAYKDERDRWVDVRSADINAYLQDALGEGFSAKDFRTWTATVLAAVGLAAEDDDGAPDGRRRKAVVRVVRDVAHQLGNTPAVARGSYVDPRVIERYEQGHTVADAVADELVESVADGRLSGDDDDAEADEVAVERLPPGLLAQIEEAVVDLIERSPRRPARPRRSSGSGGSSGSRRSSGSGGSSGSRRSSGSGG